MVIDFGVVAACAYGAKVDGAADSGLEEDDGEPTNIDDEAISKNLETLQKLEVTVAGERVANIETLRKAANQAVVVVAGPLRDCGSGPRRRTATAPRVLLDRVNSRRLADAKRSPGHQGERRRI